jgi:hypothetical protein
MDNFDLKKYLTENKLNEVDKGAMYQLIKLRDIENPYNLHKDLISSLNRFARATVAKEQGYQGVGLDNELQLTRLDVNNQAAFHKLDREEVKDTLKKALELYRSNLNEAKFTDYSNNELAAYAKELSKQRADTASKGQSDLVSGINKEIEAAVKELKKRAEKIKGLTRTDVNEQA